MICPFVRVWFLEETFQFCACSHLISIKAEEIISNPHCHQINHRLNDICIRLITKKCLWWRLCHALHIVVVLICILFINKCMLFLSGGGWGNLHNYTYGKKKWIHSFPPFTNLNIESFGIFMGISARYNSRRLSFIQKLKLNTFHYKSTYTINWPSAASSLTATTLAIH